MNITSKKFPKLKQFNKKANKNRNIRVGVTVNTPRGIGIVTWRQNENVEVAVKPDRKEELLPCYRYRYTIANITISDNPVDSKDPLYEGAWYWITNYAIIENQKYELIKHNSIFKEHEQMIPGKRTDRTISAGIWGSYKYRRYTGVNKHGEPFDFELCLKPAFPIPYGDRILYALGESNGYITDMNNNGWIFQRKIKDSDIKYGICKYAGKEIKE
ncbi:hypothetical protein [Bacillus smithii]|uniref:hypothetical protein n=1 Tax=Bacillus smithii TaxID=1479 RepID=UPI003D191F81